MAIGQELHLSTCIQLRMTTHPSRNVTNFLHLLGCDTIITYELGVFEFVRLS